jgi:probable inorganic polyphosphate/ATP-NAD kinase
MKTFFLVGNSEKDGIKKALLSLEKEINDRGGVSYKSYGYIDINKFPKVDCVITLGGDGTLIRAARDISHLGIPLIGINMGHMGYLTSISSAKDFKYMVDILIDDKYFIEKRMMITATVIREGKELHSLNALNEAVITRREMLKTIRCNVYIDGDFLNEYSSDGIIVATPTGSTAYNLSAGGPIIEPSSRMMLITAICSHALSQRSIVLSSSKVIRISFNDNLKATRELVVDGDDSVSLKNGDVIELRESEIFAGLIKLKKGSFLDNIRNKMNRI